MARMAFARRHPWFSGLVSVFLALAAIEAVRLGLFSEATAYETGFYAWETADSAPNVTTPGRFRWTRDQAHIVRVPDGEIVHLWLYNSHPHMPADGRTVEISVGGEIVAAPRIRTPGWHHRAYYLPPVLGTSDTSVRAADDGPRELRPWTVSPTAPVTLSITPRDTFVPARFLDTTDERELGIGVGPIAWSSIDTETSLGFHPWETDTSGQTFRWTSRLLASETLVPDSQRMSFDLRVDHPDTAAEPVEVTIYWDDALLHTVRLRSGGWQSIEVDLPEAGAPGVVTFRVDRTWCPADLGGSTDERTLGVAVSEFRWE